MKIMKYILMILATLVLGTGVAQENRVPKNIKSKYSHSMYIQYHVGEVLKIEGNIIHMQGYHPAYDNYVNKIRGAKKSNIKIGDYITIKLSSRDKKVFSLSDVEFIIKPSEYNQWKETIRTNFNVE